MRYNAFKINLLICSILLIAPLCGKSQICGMHNNEMNSGMNDINGHFEAKNNIQNSMFTDLPFAGELPLNSPIADPGNPDAPLDDGLYIFIAIGIGYKLVRIKLAR